VHHTISKINGRPTVSDSLFYILATVMPLLFSVRQLAGVVRDNLATSLLHSSNFQFNGHLAAVLQHSRGFHDGRSIDGNLVRQLARVVGNNLEQYVQECVARLCRPAEMQALTNPFHTWQQCCSTPEASMMLAALMATSARMYMKQKF
jgi:hypothetical protein